MSSTTFPTAGDHLCFSSFLDNIIIDFPPSQDQDPFSPASDNSAQKTNSSSSDSHDSDQTNRWDVNVVEEERKRKRLVSNRESAKRSRERKRKELEKLTKQVIEYKTGNEELMNRLRFVNLNGQMVRRENERLRLESEMLQKKLYNLRQLLFIQQELSLPLLSSAAWPCNNNNVTTVNDQNQPSLLTTYI